MSKKKAADEDRAIGLRLRADRKAAGLTQPRLAEILGVKQQQIGKYERGQDRVALATLTEMARLFGKAPESYLGGLSADDPVLPGFAEASGQDYTAKTSEAPPSTSTEVGEYGLALLNGLDPEDRASVWLYVEALSRRQSRRKKG